MSNLDETSAGTREREKRGGGGCRECGRKITTRQKYGRTRNGQGKGEVEKTLVMSCHGRTLSAVEGNAPDVLSTSAMIGLQG